MKLNTEIRPTFFDKAKEKLNFATNVLKNAKDFEDAKKAVDLYNDAYTEVASKFSCIFLKMNQDLTDEETVSSYYANSSSFADCMYYDDFYYAMKESPFYNELRAYMGVPFVEWLKFSAELNSIATAADSPSTSEILMQYQTLAVQANGDYGQFAEQFDEILQKLVETNCSMAKFYGYENFCDYGHKTIMRFDYGKEEVVKLCERVCEVVVPYYQQFRKTYAEILSQEEPAVNDIVAGMSAYTKSLGKEAHEYWTTLHNNDWLDLLPSPTKMPGMGMQRFIENIGVGPIIANPDDKFTIGWMVAHEFGHSLQEWLSYKNLPFTFNILSSADMLEISSRSMELFLYAHAKDLYENSENYCIVHLDGLMRSMISFAMGTIYEHWIYNNIDATKKERKDKYISLYRQTHPWKDIEDKDIIAMLYSDSLLFTMPTYQFCYVPAWILAVEMVKDYKSNPDATYKKYLDINTNLPIMGYYDLIKKYDMHNIFDENSMCLFTKWIDELIDQYVNCK